MRILVPGSFGGRLLLGLSIALTGAIYTIRCLAHDLIIHIPFNPLWNVPSCFINGNFGGSLTPPGGKILGVSIFILVAFIATLLVYWRRPGGHPLPLIAFLAGFFLAAFIIPLPPTYEQRLFAAHRDEFEQLVTMARQGQLIHQSKCSSQFLYATPPGYSRFSKDCIRVYYPSEFLVEFNPRASTESIVYIDEPLYIASAANCATVRTKNVLKKLAQHWYYCSSGNDSYLEP